MVRLGNCDVCKAKMVEVTYPQKKGLLDSKGRYRPLWRNLIHCSAESAHIFKADDAVFQDIDIELIKTMQKKTGEEVSVN